MIAGLNQRVVIALAVYSLHSRAVAAELGAGGQLPS